MTQLVQDIMAMKAEEERMYSLKNAEDRILLDFRDGSERPAKPLNRHERRMFAKTGTLPRLRLNL